MRQYGLSVGDIWAQRRDDRRSERILAGYASICGLSIDAFRGSGGYAECADAPGPLVLANVSHAQDNNRQ